jgi:exodeoxyribonuclease III
VRLVTWNVNSLAARLPRVLELLDQHAPDVLCLQETKCGVDTIPHLLLATTGYRAIEHSGGRWNGVALVVPEDVEVEDVQLGLPGEPEVSECRWVEATVRGIRWVSVYVPNGRHPKDPMFASKLRFLEAVRERVAALVAGPQPLVVAGDWNIAPDDRDVWDPARFVGSTHVTEDERSRLRDILALGLQDAHRAANGDAQTFTWWDYRAGAFHKGMGMRIDLALVSKDLAVRSCEVDRSFRKLNIARDKPSDHAPLVVHLDR